MFTHKFDELPENKVVAHWFLMSLNGGLINAGGFLTTGRFVSHITGFATLFGVALTKQSLQVAFGLLSVPLFFLLGSFLAGLLIDNAIYLGKRPRFDWVMALSGTSLLLCCLGKEIFAFQNFGETFKLQETYLLMVLLCLASGLQNAAITSSSSHTVRTTHLTGVLTDIGLGIAKLFIFKTISEQIIKEKKIMWLRVGTVMSFVMGSAIGAWMFLKLGYHGFIVSSLIAFYAAWHGRQVKFVGFKKNILPASSRK